jgi:long-chain acyl-CoA synthetase
MQRLRPVKTITDQSVRNCKADIKSFHPTIMVGVPAVWELIRRVPDGLIDGPSCSAADIFY